MKFTKEEAFEKLKSLLTNNGKKTLRMSERTINSQLEALIPMVATEDTELDGFIEKTKGMFQTVNSNIEKDNSDFVEKWKLENPVKEDKDDSKKNTNAHQDDETTRLLARIEALEKENNLAKEKAQKKNIRVQLSDAMKSKGINDEKWISDFLDEIDISSEMDVDAKAESYLKIYNKSFADSTQKTPMTPTSVNEPDKDLFADIKKQRESITKN